MTSEDLFTVAKKQQATEKNRLTNVPEMSVSDLALSLKKTLEQTYGRIRIRGELSGIKVVGSGHMYGDVKDLDASINIVCWKGNLSKLSVHPEDGMDVIITGRVSSYPKSSRYQIIIEQMELAGEGALLKILEERRKKLASEGLFSSERKQKLPFLPEVIGVVTSPTGAVIQDIMHRLKDRFPRHVLIWPVTVQGTGSAEKIASAIEGFNKLDGSSLPRPDLLIVARGGGSLEDLMAFNEEIVVRAVSASSIPIISAIGHETDTTLVDYAADLRAPTPTGAAEIAVPMRLNLVTQVQDNFERLISASTRLLSNNRNILNAQSAKLANPKQLLESKSQTADYLGDKLVNALKHLTQIKQTRLHQTTGRLTDPKYLIDQKRQSLSHSSNQLVKTAPRLISDNQNNLKAATRMLESLSHNAVLRRGYALVKNKDGTLIRSSKSIAINEDISIEFSDNDKLYAKTQKEPKT